MTKATTVATAGNDGSAEADRPDPAAGPRSGTLRLRASLLDVAGGLLFLTMAVWLWLGAAHIDESSEGLIGPAGFPRGIAILLGGSALLMLLQGLNAVRSRQSAQVTVDRPLSVLAAMVLVIIYPILITELGYYVATGLWLLPFLWIAGCRKPITIVLSAGGFLVFTKVLFQMVLGIPLP